ncbi:MAG: GAF domain-containing protein, partial [Nitrospira sp.]|nr:GAF domain-containing protein [Nitrospira sp.]
MMSSSEDQRGAAQLRAIDERAETGVILRQILEGVEAKVGEQFFPSLVQQLAAALSVDYAYISELNEVGDRFHSKAGWGNGQPLPPFDVPAQGPCETVLTRQCVHHPDQLRTRYPQVPLIQKIQADSYCGVPIVDSGDRVVGHLAIMDSKPMPDPFRALSILGLFAGRAAAEFDRLRFERALRKSDLTLRKIDEGTAAVTGSAFFPSLVKNLAEALQTQYAFVSKFVEGTRTRVQTLAFWKGDGFLDNFEYDLPHTPCERVLAGEVCLFPEKVQDLFPDHREDLAKLGVESYLAIPVSDGSGIVMGHLAVMDTKPMHDDPRVLSVFKIFGVRAGAELERERLDTQLKANEARLRDLFDEAPIAYVHEQLDSKFIRANRTAMRTLGITSDQVEGTYGRSFIPDTPEA